MTVLSCRREDDVPCHWRSLVPLAAPGYNARTFLTAACQHAWAKLRSADCHGGGVRERGSHGQICKPVARTNRARSVAVVVPVAPAGRADAARRSIVQELQCVATAHGRTIYRDMPDLSLSGVAIVGAAGAIMTASDCFATADFATDDGWIVVHVGPRFRQRYKLAGGRMFTESRVTLRADPRTVLLYLTGPWDWWRHARYEDRREHVDGTIHYDLWPTGRGICVHEVMYPPQPLAGGGWRVPVELSGHAVGLAYFELALCPQGVELYGRFAGVRIHGLLPNLMGLKRFAINHLLAERGELGFPFPKGTGWVGLIDAVESI